MSREKTRRFTPPKYLERLAAAFKQTGLNQQGLADRAGLKHWEVGRFLTGALGGDFEKYRRFAAALGVPWSFLLIGAEGLAEIERWRDGGKVTPIPAAPTVRRGAQRRAG